MVVNGEIQSLNYILKMVDCGEKQRNVNNLHLKGLNACSELVYGFVLNAMCLLCEGIRQSMLD